MEKLGIKKNHLKKCWELMRCQMENECAAYPECGNKCWEAAGTMRSSEAERRLNKMKNIAISEGRDMTEHELVMFKPMRPQKLCKFIERYGTCRCCPFYLYMQQMDKAATQSSGDAF